MPRTDTWYTNGPLRSRTRSPTFSALARLARAPFTSTLPPSTACAARARVLKKRAHQSQVSRRTEPSAISRQPSVYEVVRSTFASPPSRTERDDHRLRVPGVPDWTPTAGGTLTRLQNRAPSARTDRSRACQTDHTLPRDSRISILQIDGSETLGRTARHSEIRG